MLFPDRPPVDSRWLPGQFGGVKKKPAKVEEPTTPYAAKKRAKAATSKSAAPGVRQVEDAAFQKVADKIFSERKELLRKLAQ